MSESTYNQMDLPPLPDAPGPVTFDEPMRSTGGNRPPPTDGIPRFFLKTRRKEDGTYEKVEYVEILTPGDPKAVPVHKVTEALKDKYRWHYERWRNGLEITTDGVPLEMYPMLDPAQVMTLKALNIVSVEDLANVSDANLHRIPMGMTLRKNARTWLQSKKDTDAISKQNAQMESQAASMRLMEQQIAELSARLAASVDESLPEAPKGDMLEEAINAAADRNEERGGLFKRGSGRPSKDKEK